MGEMFEPIFHATPKDPPTDILSTRHRLAVSESRIWMAREFRGKTSRPSDYRRATLNKEIIENSLKTN